MYFIISYENTSEEQKIDKLVAFSLIKKFSMPLRKRQTDYNNASLPAHNTDSCFLSFTWITNRRKTRVLGCHTGFLEA